MANSTDLINLDFDGLKNDLKTFLQSQDQFKAYNFDGSNMSVLLDILAQNTNKNMFFINMLFAEAFLDSAQLLPSVISHAKDLNYTPRSARSAKASLQINFNATGQNQPYIIPKGSSFSTLIKNQNYVFSIADNLLVSSPNTSFQIQTDVYEGVYLKDAYIFLPNTESQRFKISNKSVDTDSLTVSVFEDNSVKASQYQLATTLLDLDDTSQVYFLQAGEGGYYEILFGDGIIGHQPKDNSTIILDYRVSKFDAPNGAKQFVINFDPTGAVSELTSNPKITTLSIADGGAAPEDIESIRYYAPRHFQAQERAVVPQDYEVLLKNQFPEINAVSAYGGEDANPPQFGKVFVSVDLSNTDGLPDSRKQIYADFLKNKTSQRVVIQSPQYTFFSINSRVRYNLNATTSSATNIQTIIQNAISIYNTKFLNSFGCQFRKSPFLEAIDSADDSIISNSTDVLLFKSITPNDGPQSYVLNYGVAIWQNPTLPTNIISASDRHLSSETHSVTSSAFTYKGQTVYLQDDGAGKLRLISNDGTYTIKIIDIGSVDYDNGVLTITNLTIDDWVGDQWKVYIKTADDDIIIPKDTIGEMNAADINVTVQGLKQ